MMVRCLLLTSIVTFPFLQFRNGHRNPPCGAITFGMRRPNALTHEMFENKVGRIPPSGMWLG
jgi:hypothetical protein